MGFKTKKAAEQYERDHFKDIELDNSNPKLEEIIKIFMLNKKDTIRQTSYNNKSNS